MPKNIDDVFRLIDFLKRANSDSSKPRTLAISMTEFGFMTRILGKKWGTLMRTRLSLKLARSCPVYPTIKRFATISLRRDQRGRQSLGGRRSIMHSLSPMIHNLSFAEQDLNCVYLPFRVTKEDLFEFFDKASDVFDLKGLSVTIPHKMAIMKKLTQFDPAVETIGACNTVVFDGYSRYGYNTDYIAAVLSIETAMAARPVLAGEPSPLEGQSALVLGSGGAGKAIAFGLHERGARVIITDRDVEEGERVASWLGCEFCPWEEREGYVVQILANCTPVGMFPNVDEAPMDRKSLRGGMVVFDAIYNPETTYLLRMAREKGCRIVSGVEMFVGQACLQFKLYTGKRASAPSCAASCATR